MNLSYLGAFRLPRDWANGNNGFAFGGKALAFNPQGPSLFLGCSDQKIAEVTIPEPGTGPLESLPFATLKQPFTDPFDGTLSQAGDSLGGILVDGNALVVTAYYYYDANNIQRQGHYRRPLDLSKAGTGQWRTVGNSFRQGFIAGYMAPYKDGKAITGSAGGTNIWRGSPGPSAWLFDPTLNIPDASPLVYYDMEHQTLGLWAGSSALYGGTATFGGCAVIDDELVFVGTNGTGAFGYGFGLSDPDDPRIGSPTGDGDNVWCYDPTSADKGQHAYPYRYQAWIYKLEDLLKLGVEPWSHIPTVQALDFPTPPPDRYATGGCAFDPLSRTFYVSQMFADQDGYSSRAVIHVYAVARTTPPVVETDRTKALEAQIATLTGQLAKAEAERDLLKLQQIAIQQAVRTLQQAGGADAVEYADGAGRGAVMSATTSIEWTSTVNPDGTVTCPACGFSNWDGKNGETFGLTAPTESTLIEVPTMGGRCEECHHLFSPADLAAEIPNEWGHPCHAANCRKLACESHRKPEQVEPTTEQPITKQAERLDFDQDGR